ncbi:hypothetical protein CWC05_03680 [Pseudoalteromonas ruthenica]|uniref:Uncharacterized protein n=1 Tax=Pseudoalteromonas ruthenica TaxID=151081 RepID=A0A5S3Z8M0_9GAMM|nr:hypothetical protein [Pseudoalteromonas ruthenica]TMP88543.1 hypothetical protein CWC05_03680 [Pseudoalteromonas ruthenica]
MKLIQWTVFIDILGYRDVNGAINTEEKAKEFVAFMENNREGFNLTNGEEVKKQYVNDRTFNLYEWYDIKYAFVSDSLILTFYPKEVDKNEPERKLYLHSANALFIIAIRIQALILTCFSTKGLFLRGGISNKYCYIRDHFAVGEGLVNAYKAESVLAKHPRIAFSPDVIDNKELMKEINNIGNLGYGGNQIIKEDEDGVFYLDYLNFELSLFDKNCKSAAATGYDPAKIKALRSTQFYFESHSDAIKRKLVELYNEKESKGEDTKSIDKIISKFEWLKSYHNRVLKERGKFLKCIID